MGPAIALVAATTLSSCDRVQSALNPPVVDLGWQADSTLLAANPTLLLRVVRDDKGVRAVPIGTVGARGLRPLGMTPRGWRALDVRLLHSGNSVVPYRGSDPLAPVPIARGMWEGAPLDTLPGCRVPVPAIAIDVPDGVHLLTSGSTPLRSTSRAIARGELQDVLTVVNTLVAPAAGVALSQMARYTRSVSVVATNATARPTIVVTYEDPTELPDSATRIAERPRQLIVVLDKGVYGYKPSLTFTDVSASRVAPRRRFLGALDTDHDGKAELYFGLGERIAQGALVTYGYQYEGDAWLERFSYERTRCQG
ncbi:hypothetical protein [Gemmatimonas sp.]|jgi:hypothetical protein